tara:strand:- start:677 stop:1432 length:756 start_codon:yes stop_codon:yes gene_type:complete
MSCSNTVKDVEIVMRTKVKLKDPLLICGLPDSGFVGKIGCYHFAKGIKAIKFADMYSSHLPAQTIVNEDGTIDPLKFEFFYKKGKQNLLIFTGDVQAETAEGQHIISNAVLNFAKGLGCKTVYTIGGFVTSNSSDPPKVYGTTVSESLLKDLGNFGIKNMKNNNILGMNGILFSLSKNCGMNGFGIYSETQGEFPDVAAAKELIQVLSKITGFKPDLRALNREEKRLKQLQNSLETKVNNEAESKTRGYIT